MSAAGIQGLIEANQGQANVSTKEIVKRWFVDGKEISLISYREDSLLETESFDYRTKERTTTRLTDLVRANVFENIDQYIAYLVRRCLPVINEEDNCEYRTYRPVCELSDSKRVFKITLFSKENILIWEIFDRTLNVSYLVSFDKTYIFNDDFYARYNELTLGGYAPMCEPGYKKKYIPLSYFNFNKGAKKHKTSYFRDCVVEKIERDEEDENRITAIFIKKVIAPSKFELEDSSGRYFIDSDFWLVTLMASGSSHRTIKFIDKHGSIIIEGIKDGKYFMKKLHIGSGPDDKQTGISIAKVMVGNLTDEDPSSFMKSWLVKRSLAQKMIDLANWELKQQNNGNPQVYFDIFGSGAAKEGLLRPFVTKKTFESYDAVKQAVFEHFKNKKKIMHQKKRFIVFIVRYKSDCVQTMSFPETKSWKALDKENSCYEDDDLQVFEIEEAIERYSPQQTELVFEHVKGQWLQKVVPDNCITWAIKKLREIGLYIDKKRFTSPKRTLSNNNPVFAYSLDSFLSVVLRGPISALIPPMQQQDEFPLKNVPLALLSQFNDAVIDKDFDSIGLVIELVGKMGLSKEAFELLEIAKNHFGYDPSLNEIQIHLTTVLPNVNQKFFLLKETLRKQFEQYQRRDNDSEVFLHLKKMHELQEEAFEQFSTGDLSSFSINMKQSLENCVKVLEISNKEHLSLYQSLMTELLNLIEIASNNTQDITVLKESLQAFNDALEKYIKGFGNEGLLESLIFCQKREKKFNESSVSREELNLFKLDLEKLKKQIEISHNDFIELIEASKVDLLLWEIEILRISNDDEIEKKIEIALQKSRDIYGDKNPLMLVDNLKKIANFFGYLGLKKEAVKIYKEITEILQKKYDGKGLELILQKFVDLYHSTDDIEFKRLLQEEAKAIIKYSFQRAKEIFSDKKTQKMISYLIDLAKMSTSLDLNNKALEIYKEALEMLQEEEYEDKKFMEAEMRHGLARLLYLSGKKQAAKIMLEKSFATYKVSLGYDNPRIIEVLEHLVEVLVDLRQKKEAKARFEELRSMCKKVYGDIHPRTRRVNEKFQKLDSCVIL
ncbi:MAG: hypothetical protein K1060chlam1_01063 [Candidatus Anoxychlamydiales bacterium]|nr:hypothetical protein [Candidatus Anoxychlamydiales bacterium]